MRYARRMNGYSEVPHNGEINNYLRKDLDAKATAKNTACWNLLGKVRTKRTLCFSLYTALELCGVELPRHSTLPQKDFYVTVRSKGTRSSLDNVDYRIWNAKFNSIVFSNGVTCMHPMDAWIQFAQYLNLTELVVLAEALIRRYGYAIEQFTQRLTAFHRVIGRARCEAALKLVKPSDSVQETRTRLALMLFGLPIPQTQYGITDSENGYTYTVDMAYPQYKVAIEYDGDHHRRFRKQYVRDQQKRRRLRQLGWTVIEVFADDLWNTAKTTCLRTTRGCHRDANTASWPSSTFMPGINRRQPYHQCAQRGIQEAETSKTQQSITTLIKYGVAITSHGAAIPP